MPARYAFPRRLLLLGDRVAAEKLVARGDALLGSFMQRLGEAGLRTGKEIRREGDVVYTLAYDSALPSLAIEVAVSSAGQERFYRTDVWSPNGFVLTPVSDAQPFGWGFPMQMKGLDPYSQANTAPGLDVSRWTERGPLANVLLTRVPGAGYPKVGDTTAPIMFRPDKGLRPRKLRTGDARPDVSHANADGDMKAYRPEFSGFAEVGYQQSKVLRRNGLNLLNKHRADMGLDPLNPPLRGFYSIAQNYSDMCAATAGAGHYNPAFWQFYKVPGDREGHDGVPNFQSKTYDRDRNHLDYSNENLYVLASQFVDVGVDINGEHYGFAYGVLTSSSKSAFNGWLGSPPHRATIENVIWNGHSSFADIGVNGFWTQSFVRKKQWLDCGDAYWFSRHEEIPTLSWDSFPYRALAMETWPIGIHFSPTMTTRYLDCAFPGNGASYQESILWDDPHTVADLASITFTAPDIVSDDGLFRNSSWYGAFQRDAEHDAENSYSFPYLTNAVYLRGRQIAIAPGLVLGTAIQKIVADDFAQTTVYRLHVIVHEKDDQPANPGANGSMAVIHCYHCDLDDVSGYAAHNSDVIKGVRTNDPPAYPWLESPDRWSWVDDGTITVNTTGGGTSNLLRYQCLWRFNSIGDEASCLREFVTNDDIRRQIYSAAAWSNLNRVNTDCPASQWSNTYAGVEWFAWWSADNRTLTLAYEKNPDISNNGATPYTPTLTISGTAPIAATQKLGSVPIPVDIAPITYLPGYHCAVQGRHIALDYDEHDNLTYIFYVAVQLHAQVPINQDTDVTVAPYNGLIAKGRFDVSSIDNFDKVINFGDWINLNRSIGNIAIADVNDFVVITTAYDNFEWVVFTEGVETLGGFNASGCWPDHFFVEVYRNGDLLTRQQITNHGFFLDNQPWCERPTGVPEANGYIAWVIKSCDLAVPMYAKQRNGDWIIGFNCMGQPGAFHFTGTPNCKADPHQSVCWPNQSQLYGSQDSTISGSFGDTNAPTTPLGGWISSSFLEQDELASLMQIPGANCRSWYARVV
jgi:hypothetical protein